MSFTTTFIKHHKCRMNIYKTIFYIKKIYFIVLLLLALPAKATNTQFDSIASFLDKISFSHKEKSLLLIDELYQLAYHNPDSSALLAECLYKETVFNWEQGVIDSTLISRIQNRIGLQENSLKDEALLHLSLGIAFTNAGDFSEGFKTTLLALDNFKTLKDSIFTARSLKSLGTICSNIYLHDMAQNYFAEALTWVTPDIPDFYQIKNNQYVIYIRKKNYETAIDSLQYLLQQVEDRDDPFLKVIIYLNLASSYFNTDQRNLTFECYNEVETLMQDSDNPKIQALLYSSYGIYYALEKEDYKKSLEYFTMARSIVENEGTTIGLSLLYDNIAISFEKSGELDSTIYYLKKSKELNQKIMSNLKAVESYQKYISTFLEASENKLIIAEQEIELKKRQFMVIITLAVSVFVIILLILQQQKRKKEQEKRELSARLEHEKIIQQLEKEKQEELIETQTREITSYSLMLSNKNYLLRQILDLLVHFPANEVTNNIRNIIQRNSNADKEWSDFKMHFEKVHPSFFNKLKQTCNGLTEENLRICAYFRLGLPTKKIAQILNITPQSVNIHRYRIKKKLKLSAEEDLDKFIRKI